MSWIFLTAIAQFLNAIVAIMDKYIVSDEKVMPRPFVYAFYSCILTGFWVVIYFLGFIPGLAEMGAPSLANVSFPSIQVVGMSFLAAYTFFMALVSMFDALRQSDTSTVIPIIGAISAISTFGLSYLFLEASLTEGHILGIVLLSIGSLLVAQTLPKINVILHVVHSGLFFAFHYITIKGLFDMTGFDDGFFWSRIGFVLFGLSLLLIPVYFNKIKSETKSSGKRAGILILFNKFLAGIAAFLILKATDMGEAAVVQALDGLKFVFILIIASIFGHWLPESATDKDTRPSTIFRRFLFVTLILVGFVATFAW